MKPLDKAFFQCHKLGNLIFWKETQMSKISQMIIVSIILRLANILIIIKIYRNHYNYFQLTLLLLKWIGNRSLTSWTLYIEILQIPLWLFFYMNDFSNRLLP